MIDWIPLKEILELSHVIEISGCVNKQIDQKND